MAMRRFIPVEGRADIDAWLLKEASLGFPEQAQVGTDDELRSMETNNTKVVHPTKKVDAEQRLTSLKFYLDLLA